MRWIMRQTARGRTIKQVHPGFDGFGVCVLSVYREAVQRRVPDTCETMEMIDPLK